MTSSTMGRLNKRSSLQGISRLCTVISFQYEGEDGMNSILLRTSKMILIAFTEDETKEGFMEGFMFNNFHGVYLFQAELDYPCTPGKC